MHPTLEPLTQKDLKKFLDDHIIFKVRHLNWVSKLVLVRKKSGEIRLCVYLSQRTWKKTGTFDVVMDRDVSYITSGRYLDEGNRLEFDLVIRHRTRQTVRSK